MIFCLLFYVLAVLGLHYCVDFSQVVVTNFSLQWLLLLQSTRAGACRLQ